MNGLNVKDEQRTLEDYEILLNTLLPAFPDTLFYLCSLTPVKAKVQDRYERFTNARIDAFNEGLRELARAHNIYYLHTNDLLRDSKGYLDNEYGTGDGIHLRASAYQLLADYLYTHTIPLKEE